MSEQDNIRIAQQWIGALDPGHIGQLNELRAPGYMVEHPSLPDPVNAAEEDVYLAGLSKALPDWHWEVQHMIAQGDTVVVNGIRTGTYFGPSGKIVPRTGKTLAIRTSITLTIEDGKVTHCSVYYDRLAMLKQLGQLIPGL
jgi:ketosteroid isomerase-like protein